MKDKFVRYEDLKGFDDEFMSALGDLQDKIFESYNEFMPCDETKGRPSIVEDEHPMFTEFKNDFGYSVSGRKYLKLVTGAFESGRHSQTSVWGFVSKENFQVKNKKKSGGEFIDFVEGDILKSAGWNTPTLNASRGNMFTTDYKVSWTGPNYL